MSKFVTVDLDRERKLRFDFNTISELEASLRKQFGVGITQTLAAVDQGDINFGAVQLMYAYGMRAEDRKMTPRRAGMILQGALENGKTAMDLVEGLVDAFVVTGLFQRLKEGEVADEVGDPLEEEPPAPMRLEG